MHEEHIPKECSLMNTTGKTGKQTAEGDLSFKQLAPTPRIKPQISKVLVYCFNFLP